MTSWSWIEPDWEHTGLSVTPVALPNEYLERYCAHVKAAGVGQFNVHPRTSYRLDAGGMVHAEQHTFTRDFFGLELHIYAIHVEHVLAHYVRPATMRGYGLRTVPSHLVALAVDDAQHAELVSWLVSISAESIAIADAENRAFNEKFANSQSRFVMVKPRPVRGDVKA